MTREEFLDAWASIAGNPPNPEQLAIMDHAQGPLQITAGPGVGKTYALILRVLFLLLRRKHDLKPEELFVLESWIKNIPLLGMGYELKERFFAIYDQPSREAALAAYFAWMEAIPAELYATYTPLMLTVEEWGDEIFAYFDQGRITGAFVEGANGLARVLSRMGRGYGLKALRGRLLYGLCEDRSRKRAQTKELENGDSRDGPFLGAPLSRILPQEPLVNGDASSTLES